MGQEKPHDGLSEIYLNRELSWLEFNRRVLEEAEDASQPLLERVKFLAIFSSNLDEFFEIRVAGIKQLIGNNSESTEADGLQPRELLQEISRVAHELVERQYGLWNDEIVRALNENGIRLHAARDLTGDSAAFAAELFRKQIFPILTPLAVDSSHPFPQMATKSHNLLFRARRPGSAEPLYAIVQVPRVLERLIRLPTGEGNCDFVYLSSLIKHHGNELFPGLTIEEVHAFRVTRNNDLYIDEDEADNLLRTIENELRKASRGNAVRVEIEEDCPPDLENFLLERLKLEPTDLYRLKGPISLTHLMPLTSLKEFDRLRDRPFQPVIDEALEEGNDIWEKLRRQDILLHHPYESFDTVVELISTAAEDPNVLAIKMTLYRTSGDSPLVAALAAAARNGKQVTVLVEIKARFDEANNIQWARKLEEAGVHVLYGVVGLKTHCKMMLIVRRDADAVRRYVHLGTGNYHPRTARIYTDLSLLTANEEITGEIAQLFNSMTGIARCPSFKHLLVAPFDLAQRFLGFIERERDHARAGRPAHIIVKLNSLVDEKIIDAMAEASTAGVKIDLIVRGICCLRPGVPGQTENIRVISIVGRFLEHSRIFYFENGGDHQLYLGSADWMPRNFYRRLEVAFPILCPELREEIVQEILPAYLNDRVKARELQSSGVYTRLRAPEGEKPPQAQLYFRELARKRHSNVQQKRIEESRQLRPVETFATSNHLAGGI